MQWPKIYVILHDSNFFKASYPLNAKSASRLKVFNINYKPKIFIISSSTINIVLQLQF